MNGIAKGLHISGTKYSQQTVEEGTKVFCNFLKRVEIDNYIKEQSELADGTNAFLDFIKKVRANVLRQSIERRYAFIQPRRVPEVIDLTTDSDSSSLTQSKSQSPSQNFNTSNAIQHPQNNQQDQVYTYKLNRILNGKQVQYLDNSSRELLVVLNKETPKIIANESEKRHVVSNNELKALVTIVFCKKFNIKSSNVKELERKIRQYNIETEFIETNRGYTRINVKISSLEKNSLIQESETALNGNGPEITENDIEKLLQKIQNINSNDIVILSGNIPKCINENIYEIICKELDGKNVKFVVDASQKLLMNCLKYKPFFIKPNKEELEETFNTKIETKEEIIIYAKKLQEKGAQNVLISLGGDGAILLTEKNEVYYSNTPKGQVINTVGAGDSMVAGFVAGYLKKKDYKEALKLGIASGSATAFSAGLAMNEEINGLLKQITIEKI